MLHPDVCGDSHDGLVAVHSLSKRSNFAGYRGAFLAGDPAVVAELLAVRKHAGMIVPGPCRPPWSPRSATAPTPWSRRPATPAAAPPCAPPSTAAGFRIEHSEASLYLWATRDEDCWDTVADLAERGILVAPGEFYGPAGDPFVRIAFTATDPHVSAALKRLT